MDIRRLSLWEGRYATYMSNDIFSVIIEDQGEVAVELTARTGDGTRINALHLPYFRGTGEGVSSDVNGEWWQGKAALYQSGGGYFNYPSNLGDHINTSDFYWTLRRYGTEKDYGGVWRLSEMKSREEYNRFQISKLDMLIPGHPVLYTLIRLTNTGEDALRGSPSWHTQLSYPLMETGSFIQTNARSFNAYPLASRELGVNRLSTGQVFEELKKAPLASGGFTDASMTPTPTGTYDYIIGKIPEDEKLGWYAFNNPKSRMMYFAFYPQFLDSYRFPNMDIAENYLGRQDPPWALFDGATPREMITTLGFNSGPKGTRNFTLRPGEEKIFLLGNAFFSYDNPRIGLGFNSVELSEEGITLKRTKSYAFFNADSDFHCILSLAERLKESESPAG